MTSYFTFDCEVIGKSAKTDFVNNISNTFQIYNLLRKVFNLSSVFLVVLVARALSYFLFVKVV